MGLIGVNSLFDILLLISYLNLTKQLSFNDEILFYSLLSFGN